ncbi:multiple inositol polyphosphate phosphatase 1 [Monomorium pharaonis]|uniref:multiple inositol polyphosphate phosphatase 1 n=1 Tax=Monomorium pharaonis TaxID=307658 RepID=UPI00063F4FCE|nr:multiple inositol polyphosphate phosphatase 1 [Monomorium pharaonis]
MWMRLCILVSVIYLARAALLRVPVSCHPYKNTYPYTGTKTAYSYIHNNTVENMTLTNCKPMQIWMLGRHGTRNPDETKMRRIMTFARKMRRNFPEIAKKIYGACIPPYAKVSKNWETCSEFVKGKGKFLVTEGEREWVSLGERVKAKLPTLFDTEVKNFKFKSTAKQRTILSMMSFMKGALGINFTIVSDDPLIKYDSLDIEEHIVMMNSFEENGSETSLDFKIVPTANDTLLNLYDTCVPWNNKYNGETTKFTDGPEMTKVLNDISRRLNITDKSVREAAFLLYDVCRFERAVCPNKPSPWCDAFTEDAMLVFEYLYDLAYYYDAGPGEEINSELGCHPVRDMFEHFTKLETNGDEPRGVFYFSHSHTVSLFLTAMGIGKDSVPLTAANFRDMGHRSWRISRLVPFASNFAAVFHRCDSSDTPFKVSFYLNESPVTIEGCEDGVCDWAQLKKKLGAIAANCSAEICKKEVPN